MTVGEADPVHGLLLRLTTDPRACWVHATGPLATTDGGSGAPVHGSALVEGDSLALLTHRRPDGRQAELGAVGFGPGGAGLAHVITRHVQAWDTARDATPRLTVVPAGTPDRLLPEGAVIDKHHTRLVIAYP